jgi:hypothetical protein
MLLPGARRVCQQFTVADLAKQQHGTVRLHGHDLAVLCMVAGGKGHDIPGADAGAFHAIIIHDKAEIRVQVCQRAGGLVVAHADAPSFSIRRLAYTHTSRSFR